jgi:hypothetical protein
MLKISESHSSIEEVTLLLEGRILSVGIEQLRDSCEEVLAQAPRVTIDLRGVSFVCHKGVTTLHYFEGRGVTLINCSGFVAQQLKKSAETEY